MYRTVGILTHLRCRPLANICKVPSKASSSSIRLACRTNHLESRPNDKELTHTDRDGKATMVDVSNKGDTKRRAIASGTIELPDETFHLVLENKMKKGDVLSTAKLAGIMSAKHTSSLIPLCHNIFISNVKVSIEPCSNTKSLKVLAEVSTVGKTGVEMEALTAVSVTCLTIYDMCKAVTQNMRITGIQLETKAGGVRGDFQR